MKIRLSLLFLLLAELITAQSLTFSGQVLSAFDNTPIPYAHVAIQDKPIGTISDLDGYFELTVPKEELINHQLIVSSIGYESLIFETSSSWNRTVKLSPLINELEEVVISGDKIELSAKALVESALKIASKVDKDQLIELDIEQIAHHNGILTKYYLNKEVELSRNNSASREYEVPTGNIQYVHDAGSLPVTSFMLSPEKLLAPDICTRPKLKKAKGKYSFEFTDLTTVGGFEVFEVTVLQQSALATRSALVKNDYKFFFSTENLDLLKFERKEQVRFEQGYNDIHTLEHTIAHYDPILKDDPLINISVEFNQFITRYNRNKEELELENKRELTLGHRENQYFPYDTSIDSQKYASVIDAIERNSRDEKLYLFIFWNDSFNTISENREELFELLEVYPFDELEIVCLGSTNKRSWKMQASNYPFFSHYFLENPKALQNNSDAKVQLFKKETLLGSGESVSERIIKTIRESKI